MLELFAPFKQAQRMAGGTGLGLYSFAKRMEALNGFYGVKNRDNGEQGSNFWFAIPYKPDQITSYYDTKKLKKRQDTLSQTSGYAYDIITRTSWYLKESDIAITDTHLGRNMLIGNDYCLSSQQLIGNNRLSGKSVTTTKTKTATKKANAEIPYKLNILFVDDSFSILKVVAKILRKYGHSVTEALNGADALNVLGKVRNNTIALPFDVIIMDLQMPIMDGIILI